MAAPKAVKLGPGLLTVGGAGAMDLSCRLSAARVAWSKDKEDDTDVLCGDTIAGATTYTAVLSGTIMQDIDERAGIVYFSWEHKGEQVPFVFVPSTSAGAQVTGQVIIDPLDVGGDEVKQNMTSDFEWDCVGEPMLGEYTPPPPATGANAGTPGTFTPTGALPPADLAALQAGSITAAPAAAWAAGQYVVLGDGSHAHWTGSAWAAGDAP